MFIDFALVIGKPYRKPLNLPMGFYSVYTGIGCYNFDPSVLFSNAEKHFHPDTWRGELPNGTIFFVNGRDSTDESVWGVH